MKIEFDDKSYIEAKRSKDGKVVIVIQAKDHGNNLKNIVNSVEINEEQYKQLISDI